MARVKRFGASSNTKDIIKQLTEYKKSFIGRVESAVNTLTDLGISVAMNNTGQYSQYIFFKKEMVNTGTGYTGVLIAYDEPMIVSWYTTGNPSTRQTREEEVRPLLLAEFGSGFLADISKFEGINSSLGGQGTMPNSYGHAFDKGGWYWFDKNGIRQHSKGEQPSYPLYKASCEMRLQVESVFRMAFR